MKSYPQKNLTLEKSIFSYQLSRMRRISENAFGILENQWTVFRRSFHLQPKKVRPVTLTEISLHNWLRRNSEIGKVYVLQSLTDCEDAGNSEVIEGSWRSDILTES